MKHQFPSQQSGITLIIGMFMLILLTLVSITGAQMTTLEEKMASNSRDKHTAFEAAEAGLLGGEEYIEDVVISLAAFDTTGTDGLYDNSMDNIWEEVDWHGADSGNNNEVIAYSDINSTHNVKTSPEFVVQHYASIEADADTLNLDNYGQGTGSGDVEMFRVTARGTGGSDNAAVILQSTYGKRL